MTICRCTPDELGVHASDCPMLPRRRDRALSARNSFVVFPEAPSQFWVLYGRYLDAKKALEEAEEALEALVKARDDAQD